MVGEAEVEDVLIDNPQIIWNITHEYSGINKTFLIDIITTANRQSLIN